MGASENFSELLLARALLGLGESFSAPAAYSIIADTFPPSALAQGNAVYALGAF